MITCFNPESIVVASSCTPDTGPPVPGTWSNPQPTRIRMTDFITWQSALANTPFCQCFNLFTGNWDGTLPAVYSPNNVTLHFQTAGSSGGIIVDYALITQTQQFLVSAEVVFIANQNWTFIVQCFDNLCSNATTVWQGQKTTGLTPVSGNGTYIRIQGLSGTPNCCHFQSY